MAPEMIRRVGHVRVFAALGSMISAVLVAYAVAPNWVAWAVMRVLIGFSFSGVYITAESWLNSASTNQTRGQALSLYLIMQMVGIIAAQVLLNVGDPSGYILFVIPSILVSMAFTPILLTAAPAPAFASTKALSFKRLYKASPLGCVGMFLLGGVFAAQFGMASVWGTQAGLSIREISIFVAFIYVGGLVLQYPIGWMSDRMDRRLLVLALAGIGAVVCTVPVVWNLLPFGHTPFVALVVVGALTGGISNPVYSLLVAYVNDYLDNSEMAGASAGLMFINGLGAISGPLITGWLMAQIGPDGFFVFIAVLFLVLAVYTGWRMTQRHAPSVHTSFTAITPSVSVIGIEAALEKTDEGNRND